MKFDLKRPCANCPFRTDVPSYLRRGRAQEIARAVVSDGGFCCHKTTVDSEEGDLEAGPSSQVCAGALILQEKAGQLGQAERIAERLGLYDAARLDMAAPVHGSLEAFIAHHGEGEEIVEPCAAVGPECLAPAGWLEGGAVVSNLDVDPEVMLSCDGCGQSVCEACAPDGICEGCAEYEAVIPRAPSERISQDVDEPSDDLRVSGHWAMGERYS